MAKRIKKVPLRIVLRTSYNQRLGLIYFLRASDTGAIKIGFTQPGIAA